MNRILLIPLFAASMLHGMENATPTVIELLQEEKYEAALQAIENGADISCTDICGNTPLHYAFCIQGYGRIAESLWRRHAQLANGDEEKVLAPLFAQNCAGQIPLHLGVLITDRSSFESSITGNQILAKQGIDIQDAEGRTPFEYLYTKFKTDHSWKDLVPDWPVDTYDSEGWTILHLICMTRSNWRHAQHYLEHGADPNAVSRNSRRATPLHLAAEAESPTNRQDPLFSVLLTAGADSALRDGKGNTAFDIMIQKSREHALIEHAKSGRIGEESGGGAKFLLKNCGTKLDTAKCKALQEAAQENQYEFVEFLLGQNTRALTSSVCFNPLHAFCIKWKHDTHYSLTPQQRELHLYESAKNMIELLLKAGVQINALTPHNKKTPLYLALQAENPRTMQALLELGADPHIPDASGEMPLTYLARNTKDKDLFKVDLKVQLLVQYGARLDDAVLCGVDFVQQYVHELLREAIKQRDMNALKKLIDQGAWNFYSTAILDAVSLERADQDIESKPDCPPAAQVYEVLLTHPLPGPIRENKQLAQITKSWFAFVCSVNKAIPGLKPVRDVLLKIRNMIFPSVDDCIAQLHTKNLAPYICIYGKKALLGKLAERHLNCIRKMIDIPDEEKYEEYLSAVQPEDAKFLDVRNPELRELLEKSYGRVLDPSILRDERRKTTSSDPSNPPSLQPDEL